MEQLGSQEDHHVRNLVISGVLRATNAILERLDRPDRQWVYKHIFPTPTIGTSAQLETDEEMMRFQQTIAGRDIKQLG